MRRRRSMAAMTVISAPAHRPCSPTGGAPLLVPLAAERQALGDIQGPSIRPSRHEQNGKSVSMNRSTSIRHTKIVHETVEVDGQQIFYRRSSRRDCPAVLLLHGFPSSSFSFRALMPLLSDAADLIAPDLPG